MDKQTEINRLLAWTEKCWESGSLLKVVPLLTVHDEYGWLPRQLAIQLDQKCDAGSVFPKVARDMKELHSANGFAFVFTDRPGESAREVCVTVHWGDEPPQTVVWLIDGDRLINSHSCAVQYPKPAPSPTPDEAVQMLCEHVEQLWQCYASQRPHSFLVLIDNRWVWCPLYRESGDDWHLYREKLRKTTQALAPSAAAFAAREMTNASSPGFFVSVEFPGDPVGRLIVWDVSGDHLVNRRVGDYEVSDDEFDDDMCVFKPPSTHVVAPHADPFYLLKSDSEYAKVLWNSHMALMLRMIFRV